MWLHELLPVVEASRVYLMVRGSFNTPLVHYPVLAAVCRLLLLHLFQRRFLPSLLRKSLDDSGKAS